MPPSFVEPIRFALHPNPTNVPTRILPVILLRFDILNCRLLPRSGSFRGQTIVTKIVEFGCFAGYAVTRGTAPALELPAAPSRHGHGRQPRDWSRWGSSAPNPAVQFRSSILLVNRCAACIRMDVREKTCLSICSGGVCPVHQLSVTLLLDHLSNLS